MAATIPIHAPALGDPAVVAGEVWVPEIRQNAVALVDPSTNQVNGTVKVGVGLFVVTEIAGDAWVPSLEGRRHLAAPTIMKRRGPPRGGPRSGYQLVFVEALPADESAARVTRVPHAG